MLKQLKLYADGSIKSRGIEWTDYTHNPIAGCFHRCRWQMPDGTTAVCYAEDVAGSIASPAYPEGFEHHYWKPAKLQAPRNLKTPSRIFIGSMADVFGHWVPAEQVQAVLDMCYQAHWHSFQFLTKNAPRLREFRFPRNVWVGCSSPPSSFMGKDLSEHQQLRMLAKSLDCLRESRAEVKWMSFEPLAIDAAQVVAQYKGALNWAVVGAASKGKTYYQPDPAYLQRLVAELDEQGVRVFYKGNLRPSVEAGVLPVWREEFPD